MFKDILAITGKPGLFKLVSRGNNMLIVESLIDGKRMPTYARDKIVSLADVSMYTMDDDMPLSEVLTKLGEMEQLSKASVDPKKADNQQLRDYFAKFMPNFDQDRVYPSDIKKLIVWYNLLIDAGIKDFTVDENEEGEVAIEEKKQETKKAAPKAQVKTQKSAATSVKTGVGARKG